MTTSQNWLFGDVRNRRCLTLALGLALYVSVTILEFGPQKYVGTGAVELLETLQENVDDDDKYNNDNDDNNNNDNNNDNDNNKDNDNDDDNNDDNNSDNNDDNNSDNDNNNNENNKNKNNKNNSNNNNKKNNNSDEHHKSGEAAARIAFERCMTPPNASSFSATDTMAELQRPPPGPAPALSEREAAKAKRDARAKEKRYKRARAALTKRFAHPKKPPRIRNETEPCALLFFGLARGNFAKLVLPSIQKFILKENPPHCDVYIHNYNVTRVAYNPRNTESSVVISDPLAVRALTDNVVLDTEEGFRQARDLAYYRKHRPIDYWGWSDASLDNMIRQWHAIARVWQLMECSGKNYTRVGLFRSDVLYVSPLDIFTVGDAVIPPFSVDEMLRYWNDRMFWGTYQYARAWATGRFPFVEKYLTEVPKGRHNKLHSETFIYALLHEHIPEANTTVIRHPDICFLRVRGDGEVQWSDCDY